jgi:PTS hybrid protein
VAALAGQVAGQEVRVIAAGGDPEGGLGTDGSLVERAIEAAEQGDGVVVLGDLGSAILTARHVLENLDADGRVKLADAPFVEGAVAAAVTAASGLALADVLDAAEGSRGVRKL